jgi:DNA primase
MDFVKHVRDSVDIVRVVGEYVRLKKTGTRYSGLCPFHTEKTPSFSVNPDYRIFICFGCGEKGSVFDFVMKIEGMTFSEALRSVAERNGIAMPERRQFHDDRADLKEALMAMHEIAAGLFQESLHGSSGSDARQYLNKRGLTPATVEQFGLGLSPRGGQDLTRRLQKQFPPDQISVSGLVSQREDGSVFDRFRGRLMFPIHNESGKVIGFGGRTLYEGDEPKYLNSAATEIYDKKSVLYNLHRAKQPIRKQDFAVLVEGYMDVIGVYAAGVENVVASCGTALTQLQVRAVRRHSEQIVVNFDPDTAGANATEKSLQMLLDESMSVRVLELDGDLDPDEYIKAHGADRYHEKLRTAPGYFLWMADRARRKFDMTTTDGRMQGFEFLLPSIKRISDKIERAAVAGEVASYLGVERGLVLDEFRRSAIARQPLPSRPAHPEVPRQERVLLRAMLSDPHLRDTLIPPLKSCRAVKNFAIQPILTIVCSLHDADPHFSYDDLEGRLDDREKQLLAAAVLGDHSDEVLSVEHAEAYIKVLENEDRQVRVAELRAQIREAERQGKMDEAFGLMGELSRIQRG